MEFLEYFTIVDKNYLPVKEDHAAGVLYEVSLKNSVVYSNKSQAEESLVNILEDIKNGGTLIKKLELPLQIVKVETTLQMVLI